MSRYLPDEAAWLRASIRTRLSEVAEVKGKPGLEEAFHDVIEVLQEVLDKEGWAITRRGMVGDDAPWLRLTWPHDGRDKPE